MHNYRMFGTGGKAKDLIIEQRKTEIRAQDEKDSNWILQNPSKSLSPKDRKQRTFIYESDIWWFDI